MNYFEIFRWKFAFGWSNKFDLIFFDDLEKPVDLVYYESITAEDIGQLMGGN